MFHYLSFKNLLRGICATGAGYQLWTLIWDYAAFQTLPKFEIRPPELSLPALSICWPLWALFEPHRLYELDPAYYKGFEAIHLNANLTVEVKRHLKTRLI